jgi:nicotinamide-nucleotide amidase
MTRDFNSLVTKLGALLTERKFMLTVAESCTGGMLAQVITSLSGSSQWFERGFVTYSNNAKIEMLGVQPATIAKNGAVSKETVLEMAEGSLRFSRAHISIAVTGIAGPEGGSADKPVGTVWIAWASPIFETCAKSYLFSGDREDVRCQAVERALRELIMLTQVR